jgi:hypothetical protein
MSSCSADFNSTKRIGLNDGLFACQRQKDRLESPFPTHEILKMPPQCDMLHGGLPSEDPALAEDVELLRPEAYEP